MRVAIMHDYMSNSQDLRVLKLLLDAGCPVQVSEEERGGIPPPHWGALFQACHKGYGPEAVKMLLSHGANMLETDCQGKTPIAFAANQGMHRGRVSYLDTLKHKSTLAPFISQAIGGSSMLV